MPQSKTKTHTVTTLELATIFLLLANGLAYAANVIQFQPAQSVAVTPQKQLETLTTKLLTVNEVYRTESKAQNANRLPTLFALAKERKAVVKKLMHYHPDLIQKFVINDVARQTFPAASLPDIEQSIAVEGFWSSPFADGKLYYILRTDAGDQYWLHFPTPPPDIPAESRVRVQGIRLDDDIVIPEPFAQDITILLNNQVNP